MISTTIQVHTGENNHDHISPLKQDITKAKTVLEYSRQLMGPKRIASLCVFWINIYVHLYVMECLNGNKELKKKIVNT